MSTICDKNNILELTPEMCSRVMKLISNRSENDEIEVRFGFSSNDGRYSSGLCGTESESPREVWYHILHNLSANISYIDQSVEKTLSETYDGNIRKITNLKTPEKPIFQTKEANSNERNLVLYSFRTTGDNINVIRLNKSREILIPEPAKLSLVKNSRIRTRSSFLSIDKKHRIDLTYISDPPSYEVEIEYLQQITNFNDFTAPIDIILKIIKGNIEVVSETTYQNVIDAYNSIYNGVWIKDKKKIYKKELPQPVNLKSHMISNMTAYSVTNKLNGVRMIGVIHDGNLYGIDMRSNVQLIQKGLPSALNKTVFDAEYFKGVLYIFDILTDRGVNDIRNKQLNARLNAASNIVLKINSEKIKMKVFRMSGNISNDIRESLAENNKMAKEDTDGLIFNPITLPYSNKAIYKWKPPHMLTIDFKATLIGINKWNLQVIAKNQDLVTFSKRGFFSGTIESNENIAGIGEYRWDGKTFVFERPRSDKEAPNFIDVADDIWQDIMKPITEKELPFLFEIMDGREAIRKYHNSIKQDLINNFASNDFKNGFTFADIGAGKGGDLNKYQSAKIKSLIAIEPNKSFIEELLSRHAAMKTKNNAGFNIEVINAEAQDTKKILSFTQGRKVDVVSMFFSLSFFFENELILSDLINTIDELLGDNGSFIGTTIDGHAVYESLKNTRELTLGPVKIVKKYSNFQGKIGTNKAIEYVYQNSATVSETQLEYLVDWEMFVNLLNEKGIELEQTSMFSSENWLSENDNKISSLYRKFIFKRKRKVVKAVVKEVKPMQIVVKDSIGASSVFQTEFRGYNIVKTQVIADGSCFFYAFMLAYDPKFKILNVNDTEKIQKQKQIIKEMRQSFDVSLNEWKTLGKGNLSRMEFIESRENEFVGFDANFYKFFTNEENIREGKLLPFVSGLKGGQYSIDFILSQLPGPHYSKMTIDAFIAAIQNLFQQNKKDNDMGENMMKKLIDVIDEAVMKSYTAFTQVLQNPNRFVGQEILEIVGNRYNCNIYILNENGEMYPTGCDHTIHTEERKNIILLYQPPPKAHYQCIGIKNADNTIQRLFPYGHPLIEEIRNKICDPVLQIE